MNVKLENLDNGATVVLDHNPASEGTFLQYIVTAGAAHETEASNGISHYFEHMAFKGTATRTGRDIDLQMDELGAKANAGTDYGETFYFMYGLSQDALTFDVLLHDIVANSNFPQDEVDRERGIILQEIANYADDPSDVFSNFLRSVHFPDSAMGRPILGNDHSVSNISRDDLFDYQGAHYHGGNLIIIASGGFDPDALMNQLREQTAGQMPSGEKSEIVFQSVVSDVRHLQMDQLGQIKMNLSFSGSEVHSKEAFAETVLDVIMSSGMSARLLHKVREQEGLTYNIGSYFSCDTLASKFSIYGSVERKDSQKLLSAIVQVIDELRQSAVTGSELQTAKKQYFVSSMELLDPYPRAQTHEHSLINYGGLFTREEFRAGIEAVSVQDVLDAAQRLFSLDRVFVTGGPGESGPDIEVYDRYFP